MQDASDPGEDMNFKIIGLSLVLFLSGAARADFVEMTDLAPAFDAPAAEAQADVTATSDDADAAALVESQADALDAQADQAVQQGELTPEQAQAVHATTQGAREAAKQTGFRKKLMHALGGTGLAIAKGAGFAGEAVGLSFVAPLYAGAGFTAGVLSGDTLPTNKILRGTVYVASVGGAFGAEAGYLKTYNAIGLPTSVFPISVAVLAANNVIVCGLAGSRDSNYCQTLAKINVGMTDGTLNGSRRGGSAIHKFFARVFK
jgi:hypothetical protein